MMQVGRNERKKKEQWLLKLGVRRSPPCLGSLLKMSSPDPPSAFTPLDCGD
jgi:hypothetical protein